MLNKTRLKRLGMLHRMLINHDKLFKTVAFDIGYWREHNPDEPSVMKKMKKKGISCSTAACALGSAAIYKPFNKMGLKIKKGEFIDAPSYRGCEEIDAGAEFFGITEHESSILFLPSSYSETSVGMAKVTPLRVAIRVKKLIEKYKKA